MPTFAAAFLHFLDICIFTNINLKITLISMNTLTFDYIVLFQIYWFLPKQRRSSTPCGPSSISRWMDYSCHNHDDSLHFDMFVGSCPLWNESSKEEAEGRRNRGRRSGYVICKWVFLMFIFSSCIWIFLSKMYSSYFISYDFQYFFSENLLASFILFFSNFNFLP